MKITDVSVVKVTGTWKGATYRQSERQSRQMDVYPEIPQSAGSGGGPGKLSGLYVEVATDEGPSGLFGPIEDEQTSIILKQLRPFLIGRDPLANEALLDQMLRLNRHGRSGLFVTGVSAVDCALWDLKGKAWGQPVYRLLGGPTRSAVPAYASMLGFPIDPDGAAAAAREYKNKGFTGQKWFFRYGPGDGQMGKERNLAMAHAVRDALGPHYSLMFDAFMSWDLPYTLEMAAALAPLRPAFLEEPLPPERVGALRQIRQAGVAVATGEHVYTRWQVKELLVAEAVDVVQTDPDWTGGITELVKICAVCSAFSVPMVAHGHSLLPALHVAASQSPTVVPMVEYLVRYQEHKQALHKPIYEPEDGSVKLPTLPGLGLVLDDDRIETREKLSF